MTLLFLLSLLLEAVAMPDKPLQTCLNYEPAPVTLAGLLARKRAPGPPNYESVAKGDQSELIWILHLDQPACVSAGTEWPEESNVIDVQLAFPETRQYSLYRSLVGKRVTAVGTLFHEHTGHHRTKVLLTVRSMKSVGPVCDQPANERNPILEKAEKERYSTRRLEFIGNVTTRDSVLRRRVLLQEGEFFRRSILLKSLRNVSVLKAIYPVTMNSVTAKLNESEKTIDFQICFRERR